MQLDSSKTVDMTSGSMHSYKDSDRAPKRVVMALMTCIDSNDEIAGVFREKREHNIDSWEDICVQLRLPGPRYCPQRLH
jgi:hypothetical protein